MNATFVNVNSMNQILKIISSQKTKSTAKILATIFTNNNKYIPTIEERKFKREKKFKRISGESISMIIIVPLN